MRTPEPSAHLAPSKRAMFCDAPLVGRKMALWKIVVRVKGVESALGKLEPSPRVSSIASRTAQCLAAVDVCRRLHFSDPLQRALTAKLLALETEVSALKRAVRAASVSPPSHEGD